MKLSLNWIREYVEIPEDLVSHIATDLTMKVAEVEEVIDLSKMFDNMIIGVIKEVLPHPNADKLRICEMDLGEGLIKRIVCGGSNLSKGMKVVVALENALVRWHGEGDLVPIKNTKIRGIESFGMICASSEIGLEDLFPLNDEDEIIDLSDFDIKAGDSLAIALKFDDLIFVIDNKSLTNRPDLWGHYGIAREIATIYNLSLIEFIPFNIPKVKELIVNIENKDKCPRYVGLQIENIEIKESPFFIKSLLWKVGMRPVNQIVDITNYVMLTTGQPTHAFDADNIKGNITVRQAKDSERLVILNNEELILSKEDLVIADDEKAIGLAGIMGGINDSILPKTNKIFLEIANFDAISIRHTSLNLEIKTEASIRYEKNIDSKRVDIALFLAMKMFKELIPNMEITNFIDNYPKPMIVDKIDVSLDWLEKRLGKFIPKEDIECILKNLGFDCCFDEDIMHLLPPSWRFTGDIKIKDDILEEIVRIYGIENFDLTPITTTFESAINQIEENLDRKIKEYLAYRCGMREIFTYPWMDDEYIKDIINSNDNMFTLLNPPSPNERFIKSSLLPNLIKAVVSNIRYFNEFQIFESSQIFINEVFKNSYDELEKLPIKKRNIAGCFVSNKDNIDLLFKKVKGIIEYLPHYIHIEPISFSKQEKPIWADDIVWLNIIHNNKNIGNIALLSKKISLNLGIKNSTLMIFELDIDLIKSYPSRTNKFVHLKEYPTTEYDISLLFDLSVKWEEILNVIKNNNDNLIQDISFIEEYKGKQIPEDKKSITFRLLIASLNKTLKSNEIENCANNIIKNLEKKFNAILRDK